MANTTSLKADIAFMKDLAEAGVSAPILGGRITVFSGSIFSAASLVQWWLQTHGPVSPWSYPILWIGASVITWTATFFMVRKMRTHPGARSPANRASGLAWRATGVAIAFVVASAFILMWRLQNAMPFTLLPAIIVCLHGAAWMVGASMSDQKWMWAPALGAFGFALVLSYFITSPHLFLIFAAALVLLAVVPGLMLIRREPSLIV